MSFSYVVLCLFASLFHQKFLQKKKQLGARAPPAGTYHQPSSVGLWRCEGGGPGRWPGWCLWSGPTSAGSPGRRRRRRGRTRRKWISRPDLGTFTTSSLGLPSSRTSQRCCSRRCWGWRWSEQNGVSAGGEAAAAVSWSEEEPRLKLRERAILQRELDTAAFRPLDVRQGQNKNQALSLMCLRYRLTGTPV